MLKEFFSQEKAVNNFKNFGTFHIVMIVIAISFMLYCFNKKESKKFEKFLVLMMFLCQGILFAWYTKGPDFIRDGLPLYTCRIAGIIFVVAYINKNVLLKSMGVYLGLAGGIISMSTPDLYDFSILHFTNINFFVFHICLLGLSTYYLRYETEMLIEERKRVQVLVGVILCMVAVVNLKLGTNYSFTITPPILQGVYESISWEMYFLILVSAYQLAIYIELFIAKRVLKKHDYEKFIEEEKTSY